MHYEWYTDSSSTVINGQRRAGYTVVTLHETMEAKGLPAGTSAQLAELVALTRALELSKGKRVNIFTDSRYVFGVLHTHAGLWKQRGMLTAQGSPVKHGLQILRLLEAVQLPSAVAVVHCKAHQREDRDVARVNARADREAKQAATLEPLEAENAHMHALIPSVGELPAPQYSHKERNLADTLGLQEKEGWLHSTEGKILLPKNLLRPVLQKLHQTTHAGREALTQLMNKYFLTSGLRPLASKVQAECLICQKNNPRPEVSVPPATLEPTPGPGLVWQIDFTEFPRTKGFRYLLVLVDRFSGWPEAFPCRNNTAKMVALKFVKEIIPRFGLPQWMESDNGTHFTSKVVQHIADSLQIPWKLHTPWRPQASGVVERTNQTLKRHLSKSAVLCSLHRYTKELQPLPLDVPVHSLKPGDSILIRTWKDEPLQEKWKGPHTVLQVSHAAAKVEGHKNWIHHSHLKAVPAPERWTVQPTEKTASDNLGLKLLFRRQ
ncbi:hypothetical protein G0U57_020933 [Chelydra serpentina]|uniref:Uncharacterized protein n=1 Tax=Chelydra serpentina TaxID=8475 RepID=A0A8T1SUP4_CHESE|nr:hypothetical protein G0U57_020933 [Chelydra serpentina]